MNNQTMRIGYGFDVHRLVEGRELWIGGVKIEHDKGLLGHSDADVAIHALCDALLGAAALRDIGHHFSDTDPQYKGIDSRKLLREVIQLLDEKGYRLGNCDITICAEQPKMNPHIPAMQQQLAECMQCPLARSQSKPLPLRAWATQAAAKASLPTPLL